MQIARIFIIGSAAALLGGGAPYANVTAAEMVFVEQDGLLVMEAESTTSKLGAWKPKTDNPGFTGRGHLEFTGNGINGGKPDSPLT